MANSKEKVSSKSTSAKKKSIDINLVDLVVKGMQEKKGHAITIIDLKNVKTAPWYPDVVLLNANLK